MLTQRQVGLILIGGQVLIAGSLAIYFAILGTSPATVVSTSLIALLSALLFWAFRRGWGPARHIYLLIIAAGVVAGLPTSVPSVAGVLPAILALALTDWRWVAGMGVGVLAALIAKGALVAPDAVNAYLTVDTLSAYLPIVGVAVMGSLALGSARKVAEQSARQAEADRALAEQRSAEAGRQAAELNAQNARQRELLDLVSTLETPAVSVAEGVLLSPLVGSLDSQRADQLTRRLLEAVHSRRIRLVILDIAGVPVVDTAVAGALTSTVRALRLLGCEVVLTGISATVATTLTTIGASLQDLSVAASPQDALARHFGQPGA